MADEKKRLIRVRTQKAANFRRDGEGKKKKLSETWRRPRGLHNKQRLQKKAKGPLPAPGYGSPIAVRGMHPSGFREILVFNPAELDNLDPDLDAIRIGGSVGGKKRAVIQEKAVSAGLKILNPKEIKTLAEEDVEDE